MVSPGGLFFPFDTAKLGCNPDRSKKKTSFSTALVAANNNKCGNGPEP